ncbi:MAG: hypothetical protein ACOX5I_07445 [Gleimia sp.]
MTQGISRILRRTRFSDSTEFFTGTTAALLVITLAIADQDQLRSN